MLPVVPQSSSRATAKSIRRRVCVIREVDQAACLRDPRPTAVAIGRPLFRDRVRVTVDELPSIVLAPEDSW
jgi:hypothetical protein